MSTIEQLAETALPGLRGARLAIYALLAAVAIAVLGFAIWWVFIHPHELKQQAAQGKADTAIAAGAQKAAADALRITVDVNQHKAAIDQTTEGNQHAILSAPGAAAPVDPALFAALHAALCVRDAYRAEPDCAPVPPAGGSVGSAEADPGGGPPVDAGGR